MKNVSMITLSIIALLSYNVTGYAIVGYEQGNNNAGEVHIMGNEVVEHTIVGNGGGYEKDAPIGEVRTKESLGEGEVRALQGEMNALDGSSKAEIRAWRGMRKK